MDSVNKIEIKYPVYLRKKEEYSHKGLVLFFLFVLLQFTACEKETDALGLDFGYPYYPLEIGQEKIFKVDSIVYALEGTRIDTTSGFVRERIFEANINSEGDTVFSIQRAYRESEQNPWIDQEVVTATRTRSQAIRQEGNLPFLKLVFPIQEDSQWNPTAFFSSDQPVIIGGDPIAFYKGWGSSVRSLNEEGNFANQNFEEVLVVQQADLENLIELRKVEEHYAPGVGLIFRKLEILDTQCRKCCAGDTQSCLGLPWPEKAEQGLIVIEQLYSF